MNLAKDQAVSDGRGTANGFLAKWVSRTLLGGMLLSFAFVLPTAVFLLINGKPLPQEVQPFSHLPAEAAKINIEAILDVGIVVLLLTPALSVAVSCFTFAKHHDWFYMGASLVILAILIGSIIFAST